MSIGDHLTTLMITHNMKDAITHGNRLIMMMEGKIILDIRGEEKKKLTVEDLLHKFEEVSGKSSPMTRRFLDNQIIKKESGAKMAFRFFFYSATDESLSKLTKNKSLMRKNYGKN